MPVDYASMSDSLREGTLIAFVGAGVSRAYTDTTSGQTYPGLMSSRDIVDLLSKKRSYIQQDMSFPDACFLYKQKEGRVELERILQECIDRPSIRPLPAHVILANISFAAYITTNFDKLLEHALQDAKKQVGPVIQDDDVSRLRPTMVPVIKLHGCITRPNTMVAAEDEYVPLGEKAPIIEALLKMQLANKAVLFLGYSLQDTDFKLLFDQIKRLLGDYMPRSYAVIAENNAFRRELWKKKGVTVIEGDLTDFLRGLLRASVESKTPTVYHPGDDWINNLFFESLYKIRTSPSETQAIDAFLDHLMTEIRAPGLLLRDILDRAEKAITTVLEQKPNFQAFRKTSTSVIPKLRENCMDKEEAEEHLRKVIEHRSVLSSKLRAQWKVALSRGENFLTYSQSVRVLELLKGAPKGIQDTCHVYIAECRPKSPVPFQDALAICEGLAGTGYQLTLIPDSCMGNLIARRQIHKIFLGAHAVYLKDGNPEWFVNTCGTSLILDAALRYKIPVFVVAESSKFVSVIGSIDEQDISYEEEEQLFDEVMPNLSNIKASGQNVGGLNIGYDLCLFAEGIRLLSESS